MFLGILVAANREDATVGMAMRTAARDRRTELDQVLDFARRLGLLVAELPAFRWDDPSGRACRCDLAVVSMRFGEPFLFVATGHANDHSITIAAETLWATVAAQHRVDPAHCIYVQRYADARREDRDDFDVVEIRHPGQVMWRPVVAGDLMSILRRFRSAER